VTLARKWGDRETRLLLRNRDVALRSLTETLTSEEEKVVEIDAWGSVPFEEVVEAVRAVHAAKVPKVVFTPPGAK
jgi:biopolymer transport protein ExbD